MDVPISSETLSHLINSIYDCALDPNRWSATLAELSQEMHFASATLLLLDMTTGALPLHVIAGINPPWSERVSLYVADAVAMWGGAAAIRRYPMDRPTVLSAVQPRANWEDNPYNTQWAKPQGIDDVMAIGVARDRTAIGFGRHVSAGPIGDLEVDAGRLFGSHLRRAVAITQLLDIKSVMAASFGATLDTLAVPVILTDANLRIVHANRAAGEMLASGEPLGSQRGFITMRSPTAIARLGAAVRQVADDDPAIGNCGLGVPATAANGTPAVLHVLPLRHGAVRSALTPTAAAAIFVAHAAMPIVAPGEALAALFNLTAAERRILERLVDGETQSEIARALGIKPSTVKTHLLCIFSKTGTRRQAELVKLGASFALPVR